MQTVVETPSYLADAERLFSGERLPVFMLAAFAKNEKANLTASERNALSKLVEEMVRNYRRRR